MRARHTNECHRSKTTEDVKQIAKVRRLEEKRLGTKRKRWKKKIGGNLRLGTEDRPTCKPEDPTGARYMTNVPRCPLQAGSARRESGL